MDVTAENIPGTQNKVKGQDNKIIDKTLLSISSPAYITFIKCTDAILDVYLLVACIT